MLHWSVRLKEKWIILIFFNNGILALIFIFKNIIPSNYWVLSTPQILQLFKRQFPHLSYSHHPSHDSDSEPFWGSIPFQWFYVILVLCEQFFGSIGLSLKKVSSIIFRAFTTFPILLSTDGYFPPHCFRFTQFFVFEGFFSRYNCRRV